MPVYPWMESRYDDREAKCAECGGTIKANEPRLYNSQTKECAHHECIGRKQMGDGPKPNAPPPGVSSSERSEAIAKAHQDNMLSAELTRAALNAVVKAIDANTAQMADRNDLIRAQLPVVPA